MARLAILNWRDNRSFWVLALFLGLVFLTGGGARADIGSLFILRSVAALVCAYGLFTLQWRDVTANRFLFGMAATILLLVGLHLVPLPASIWHGLPGRELIVQIDKTAGLGEVARPLATVPHAAWNALYALLVPLAVLILGVQLTREQRAYLLPLLIGIGLLSGLIGLIQAIGDPNGPLYFYRVTNNGAAVGFFANRNHQAVLLATLFPMLAAYACTGIKSAEAANAKLWGGVAFVAFLIPLILVTGSRAGLITGVIGLVSAVILYRRPQIATPKRRGGKSSSPVNVRYLAIGFGLILIVGLSIILSRAEALDRLTQTDSVEEQRFLVWPIIAKIGTDFAPWGSGIGSFVEIYQVYEPKSLLDPTYLNHAHNDWLEVWMTAGIPGAILLALAIIAFVRQTWRSLAANRKSGSQVVFARLGAVVVLIWALASIGDYPLRVPSLACVFVIAVLWMRGLDDAPEVGEARR